MRSLQEILKFNESEILSQWLEHQQKAPRATSDTTKETDRREQSRRILSSVVQAVQSGELDNIRSQAWKPVLDTLSEISTARAMAGSTSSDTATFLFSLKQPIFGVLQRELGSNASAFADALWVTTTLVDKLGVYSIEAFQKTREDLIRRQQQEMMELSTPVVKLFDELVALPLIGTLDSARTQIVMENLLESIVASSASIAILDITGVPTVDTQVAQHLLKTVAAARLMGADCIISGVRPQIAQTIVHLGLELNNVTTKATMADALKVAFQRLGYNMVRRGA